MRVPERCALVVIDVQVGFDDPVWGRRNNPACEANVELLVGHWRDQHRPVVFVRHDSDEGPGSPLTPGSAGNALKPFLRGEPDLLITKQVHSAFYGRPDLDSWLREHGINAVAICGIATDHCCETTARMAGDLGYQTYFVLDATHAFDRTGPDGRVITADQICRATAASLHQEFATVTGTAELVGS
ncbi:MAG TPA: cysteine hydrolase family protein [Candidatus Dormibacteraeota bacterium]|nr:cysteine hydrolase family protein [Candidatus Dormibacteraeota bacterium]